MKLLKNLFFSLAVLLTSAAFAAPDHEARFSVAGFYPLEGTGRNVFSMNPAWRFHKGDAPGTERPDYDDRNWKVVSLPDGMEELPADASGCVNYQGPVWYRKHFSPADSLRGKRLFLHFEAIMGYSEIWVNGTKVRTNYGGFLPITADITEHLRPGSENLIAVKADNSDNPSYPPGKPQQALDFAYFGGIYRDCWLIAHNPVYITDPNTERLTAGGGLFVSFRDVSEQAATMRLDLHVRNASTKAFSGKADFELKDADGRTVWNGQGRLNLRSGADGTVHAEGKIRTPRLWSPESPTLYRLNVRLYDRRGQVADGYTRRIGIRSLAFKGKDGFWLNGKPYPDKLIGANRHQDFAVVGNALSNSQHWRDAKKLRDAGLRMIRNAHYPQDPAFMDACDELGLFVIVNTPGWQFWNNEPVFAERVYDNIRQMVRRDRNHPCVWLWEPILNETHYPDTFAQKVDRIVHEEYPYPSCYTACDSRARGSQYFKVQFAHPSTGNPGDANAAYNDNDITFFTREWGDNVDDWGSHNSPSRVARNWGEVPMLVQAEHYAHPAYTYTCFETLYRTPRQHVGGALWHSFDHQRGYHPDPFYGGIMDAYRQPKTSYYLFQAQRNPRQTHPIAESGPMVYIANALTPFSPADVTVYSNCDTVRLTAYGPDGEHQTYVKPAEARGGIPSPVITFRNVWNPMRDKELTRRGKHKESYLLAEAILDGRVAARHQVFPARRPSRILLWADNEGQPLRADGSDMVTVVAAIADQQGNIKRLNNYAIRFTVEGEGELVGDTEQMENPCPVRWGTAPILLRSTTRPGRIRIHASVLLEGKHQPAEATLELESHAPVYPLLFSPTEADSHTLRQGPSGQAVKTAHVERIAADRLKEVEQQQSDFE